jgi:hypothetical protein
VVTDIAVLEVLPDGGFKLLTPNSSVFNKDNCLIYLHHILLQNY